MNADCSLSRAPRSPRGGAACWFRAVLALLSGLAGLACSAQNLLVNGDFSATDGSGHPSSWSMENAAIVSIDTADYPSGASRSLKIDLPVNGGSGLGYVLQSLGVAASGAPLTPNTGYLARVWVKSSSSGDAKLEIKRYDASNNELQRIDSSSSGTGWSQVQVGFDTGTAARIEILLRYAKDNTTSGQTARFAEAELVDGSSSSLGTVTLVPTFNSIGVYAPVSGALVTGANGHTLELEYRPTGSSTWLAALAADPAVADNEFRGSVLQLAPDTAYEIRATLKLAGATVDQATTTATTWSDTVTVGTDHTLPASTTSTYTITAQGTATSWVRYKAASGGSTIDVGTGSDYAVYLDHASYVVIDGLTLKGGRLAAVYVDNSDHIRIVNCDISGWSEAGTFGANTDSGSEIPYGYFTATPYTNTTLVNLRAGIYVYGAGSQQVVIERNLIHHPVGKAANWVYDGGTNHPAGPSGIILHATGGNNVIRDNDIVAGAGHFFNDVIESKENGQDNGGPYRDTDISGNLLAGANDDGTELDGGQMNVRYWYNWVEGNNSSLSTAPNRLGPSYVFRNLFVGGDERGTGKNGFKLGGTPGVVHFVNNTVMTPGYGFTAGNYGSVTTYLYTRNNLFTGPLPGPGFLRFDKSGSWSVAGDIDHDLHPVDGINSSTTGWEPNGEEGFPDFADRAGRSFLLAPGSAGIGDSVAVPQLAAAGDDLGAVSVATGDVAWPLRTATPDVFPLRSVVRVRAGSTAVAALLLDAPAATGSTWSAEPGESWLSLSAASGSTGAAAQAVNCTVDATSLDPGRYPTFVSFRTDTGALRTALVDVEVEPATDILFTGEAEASLPQVGFEDVADAGASGGHYAHAIPEGGGTLGALHLAFTVATPGNYYVHARVRADGPSYLLQTQNSFNLHVDNTTDLRWDLAALGTEWSWDTAQVEPASVTQDLTGPFYLGAGSHYIEVVKRESGAQIDLLAVSNSPFPPRVEAPAFSPAGGTYGSAQSVTLTSGTSGATIRYTTDGSTPTRTNGTTYAGAVSVAADTVLKAFAYDNAYEDSPVAAEAYTITGGSSGGGAFQMSGGEVVMEAEHFATETTGDSHDWTLYTQSGASGGATDNVVQAAPNTGTGYGSFNAAATHVDYAVDVPSGSGGNFYVHLRALGPTTSDDSVYLSVDGGTTTTVQLNFTGTLDWRTTSGTLAIPDGAHTLTVWMREDGAIVDKIVVNTTATAPSGTGPVESAQSGSGGAAFQPDTNGDFVMEAEHYDDKVDGTDAWTLVTDASASGGASDNALQALPNDGTAYAAFDPAAAHVDYRIEVPAAGSYYVHLRDYGATSSDDSVYVSIDGGSTTQTVTAGRSLDWKSSPGTLSIPAGVHTLTVWEREDGTEFDKVVVSPSSSAPTGSGPAESPRS